MTDGKKIIVSIIVMLLLAVLIILTGCAPEVVTEHHYEHHHTTDTVLKHDSVTKEKETVIREADSAMVAELGLRLKEGERAILILRKELERVMNKEKEVKHDTVVQRDSIPYPVEVEKPLTWWQRQKLRWGEIALTSFLALLILMGVKLYIRK